MNRRLALAVVLAAASGMRVTAAAAQEAPLRAPNVVVISPRLTTSGQPSADALSRLGAAGYGGVIYLAPLTMPDAVRDEAAIVERQGLGFTNIPIQFNKPAEQDFDEFAAALKRLEGRKVLVHCQVNMRASSMVFLHRAIVGKENPETAYLDVTRVWSPDGTWRQFIVSMLKKHGIAFDPY